MRYNSLSPESQDKLMTFLEYLVAEESKKMCPIRTHFNKIVVICGIINRK